MNNLEIIHADVRYLPLADESVQCIVTSPPYWGLRKYAGEQEVIWLPVNHPKGTDFPAMCPHEWVNEFVEINEAVGNWQQAENGPGLASGVPQTRFRGDVRAANGKRKTSIARGTCSRCGAWKGAYGLEPKIEMYIEHTVEILRECRRVLRRDGVLFWNIGDSYNANYRWGGLGPSEKQNSNRGTVEFQKPRVTSHESPVTN